MRAIALEAFGFDGARIKWKMGEECGLRDRLKIAAAMFIFGTVGLFRRGIGLSSGVVAMARGAIGLTFLLVVLKLRGGKIDRAAVRRNLPLLCASGAAMGLNWALLFEAYNYTSVAVATLCYYFAPMLIILASPFLLKERLTPRRVCCVLVALVGMALVSGVLETGASGDLRGPLLSLGAAALYASVVLMNKRLSGVGAVDRTAVQLVMSSIALLPYVLLSGSAGATDARGALLLLLMGVLHTGAAYVLYFGALPGVRAQTAAILSYIDPVVAVLLSALILREPMGASTAAGAILVLGAAALSEMPERKPLRR